MCFVSYDLDQFYLRRHHHHYQVKRKQYLIYILRYTSEGQFFADVSEFEE